MYPNLPTTNPTVYTYSTPSRESKATHTTWHTKHAAAQAVTNQPAASLSCLHTKPLARRVIRPHTQMLAALTAAASLATLLMLHVPSTSTAACAGSLLLAYVLLASTVFAYYKG